MRKIIPFILFLFCSVLVLGNDKNPKNTSGGLHIKYQNHVQHCLHKDSVLVILDKYDRTGAGIVKQIFYPDRNKQIIIPEIPRGKYVLIIKFMGFHTEKFVKIVTVKKAFTKKVVVSLSDWEEFTL